MRHAIVQVRVDGCLVKVGSRCDFIFELREDCLAAAYVELKRGRKAAEAVTQLKSTMDRVKPRHDGWRRICYAAVGGLFRPDKQKLIDQVKAQYSADLLFRREAEVDDWVQTG
jgi:hypothetical protein